MYYALLLISSAFNLLFLSEPDKALSEAEESLKCFENFGSRWGQSWGLWLLHLIDMSMGNPAAAENKLRKGLDLIHGMDIGLNEGQLKISLSMLLVQKRQFEEAQQLLQEIDNRVARLEWYRFWIAVVYARLYTETGDHESALHQFNISVRLSEAKTYDFWIVFGKDWMIPLLVGLYSQGKMKPYIRRIFKALGPEAESDLSQLHKPRNTRIGRAAAELMQCLPKPSPPALKIKLFGRFRLFRGSEEIPAERWKSRKALMIFKYLICQRMRGYAKRDMLMELIWPDEDPEKTRKRFHVALAALRKTLEPELPRGVPSSYILSSGDAYLLNIGEDGGVDTEHFTRELDLAKTCADSSIQHHLNAEALYSGHFLAEDLYVPWCEDERERLLKDYLYLLEKIIGFYESQKQFDACIDYAGKYLVADQYAEHIYQKLIKYYASMGNNAMAARTFQKCRQHIAVELNIPLSSETEKIYKEILAANSP
jgi:LuxR family maltose regulon positive regulatory protein